MLFVGVIVMVGIVVFWCIGMFDGWMCCETIYVDMDDVEMFDYVLILIYISVDD